MRRNNKGFTIVELLVVIAIMLSILGVVIFSVNKISEAKKEEAYVEIKKQIMTAGKQYFETNEYLFEGLGDNSMGVVPLKVLVSEDYINTVVDPRTGNKLNKCSEVVVTKNNGKYTTKYKENDSEICDVSKHNVVVKEPGAPSGNCYFYQIGNASINTTPNSDKWFNKSTGVKIIGDNENNGNITKIQYMKNDEYYELKLTDKANGKIAFDEDTFKNDTNIKTGLYKITNSTNRSVIIKTPEAGVDTVPPIGKLVMDKTSWVNTDVNYKLEASDDLSGLGKSYTYWNKYGMNESTANSSSNSWNQSRGEYNNQGGTKEVNLSGNSDTYIDTFYAEGIRKTKVKICDKAGNCTFSNEGIAKIDKSAPTASIKMSNYSWTNKPVDYTLTASDNFSGLSTSHSYWNNGLLSESAANQPGNSWNEKAGCYNNPGGDSAIYLSGTNDTYVDTFSWQGVRKIKLKVCDSVGNCAYTNEGVAKIDTTPPNVNIYNPSGGKWVNYDITLTYNAYDNDGGSGIDSYYYKDYPSDGWHKNPNTNSATYRAEGSRLVSARVRDRAGNYSNESSTWIQIDKTPPVYRGYHCGPVTYCNGTPNNGDFCEHDKTYKYTIKLMFDESLSGVEHMKYNHCHINGKNDSQNCSKSGFTNGYVEQRDTYYKWSGGRYDFYRHAGDWYDNKTTMRVSACDNAGNCSNFVKQNLDRNNCKSWYYGGELK